MTRCRDCSWPIWPWQSRYTAMRVGDRDRIHGHMGCLRKRLGYAKGVW